MIRSNKLLFVLFAGAAFFPAMAAGDWHSAKTWFAAIGAVCICLKALVTVPEPKAPE